MLVYKPPTIPIFIKGKPKIFLAGSIEQGTATNWQNKLEKELSGSDGYILNPRREAWDSSWVQSIENKQFREQVEWELDGLDKADIIFLYLDPETKSPISLLELGLHAADGKIIACAPDNFWRKGNVEIVCKRYNIPLFEDFNVAINYLKEKLGKITIMKNENANYLFEELKNIEFEKEYLDKLYKFLEETDDETLSKSEITLNDLEYIGDMLGVDWNIINREQLIKGIEKELEEHEGAFGDNLVMAAKIAIGHLEQTPDYYDRLEYIEEEDFWEKIDRLYNEYSSKEKPSSLKGNIILFVLSNIRSFTNKHHDIMDSLPEIATKRLIKECMIAGLIGSKTLFREDSVDFDKIAIEVFTELTNDLNLKLDKSKQIGYNDVNEVFDMNMKKAFNEGKREAWESDTDKYKYLYLAKSESDSFMFEFDDLLYLVNTNGHIYNIERLRKGK